MKNAILLFLALFFLSLNAQEPFITGDFDNFYPDGLGNIYTIDNNTITKYNSAGDKQEQYTSLEYGTITSIDISNPLKLLVYFREFDRILLLDKYLSPTSESIRLNDHGIINSTMAGIAYDNGIWIFDSSTGKLNRLDRSLNISHQSDPLTDDNYTGEILFLREINQQVLLGFQDRVIIFDQYASYDKAIPLDTATVISYMKNAIIYLRGNQLIRYNFIKHTQKQKKWPYGAVKAIRFSGNTTYYLNQQGIYKTKSF